MEDHRVRRDAGVLYGLVSELDVVVVTCRCGVLLFRDRPRGRNTRGEITRYAAHAQWRELERLLTARRVVEVVAASTRQPPAVLGGDRVQPWAAGALVRAGVSVHARVGAHDVVTVVV